MRRQLVFPLFVLSLIFISASSVKPQAATAASGSMTKMSSTKEAAFQDAMRKLWEDHITWTRVFIISAAADLPDKASATERLLQNQVDMATPSSLTTVMRQETSSLHY